MEIRFIKTKLDNTLPVLLDDNGAPIMPVVNYMKFLLGGKKSSNTISSYCYRLKHYFEWLKYRNLTYLEAIEEEKFVDNIIDFKYWLLYGEYDSKIIPIGGYEQKSSEQTVNLILNTVFSFYEYLHLKEGGKKLEVFKDYKTNGQFHTLLSEMYAKKGNTLSKNIFRVKVPKKKLEYITREQYFTCYNNASNLRNKVMIGLFFEGGMRVSEIIGLNISDFKDIRDRVIYITNHYDKNNKDAAVKYDSEGIVIVPKYLQKDIIEYMNTVLTEIDTNYFFVNLSGDKLYSPMTRRNIDKYFKNLGKKVGIPDLHPHQLRHGLAVNMLSNGCSMTQIKDVLRHKHISTTIDTYADYDDTAKRAITDTYHDKTNANRMPDKDSIETLADYFAEDDLLDKED